MAEGFGRSTKTEYIRFLQIARGSLFEMQTQLDISKNLNYLKDQDIKEIESQTIETGKMLNALISSIKKSDT
ncbi:MAG: four helix bundle protein [Proteobacteria bacterium]|nr:four helix bundle protein [Pseudomonadota bacterium]